MDTKELKTFLALCDTLNYQKAAEKLCYAPSTLNKHVQVLEHELGTRLFAKVGRQIEITPEGAEFRPHAEKILSDYYRAIESLSSTAQMEDCLLNRRLRPTARDDCSAVIALSALNTAISPGR